MKFENVTATAEANIYFDGCVVSHAITLNSGEQKTLGVIFEGEFHFGTDLAERMEISKGACEVLLDGATETLRIEAGEFFDVPAKSGFTITVGKEGCQYVCSFLQG